MSLAHAAKGTVIRVEGDTIVFKPANTTYELQLQALGYDGPVSESVEIVIRAAARKAYTVPSGGLFVAPIMGTPRILQGRVKAVSDEGEITLNCGVLVNIKLSDEPGGIELARGPIEVGSLVNVVLRAGARAESAIINVT